MKKITVAGVPAAVGPYSQAIEAGGFLFASGQLGLNPETAEIVEGGIKEQTEQALKNISNLLKGAGYDMSCVVKAMVFLTDMSTFAQMNEVYSRYFSDSLPARSAVAVKALPKGGVVEIEVIAVKK